MKGCTKCHLTKPLTEFSKDSKHSTGLRSSCKDCDKEGVKGVWLRRVWPSLSREQALIERRKLFDLQNGCCAICNRHESEFETALAVDHCHLTNKVRGLLCKDCNFFLGKAKDNIDILKSGIKYLENSK